MQMSLTQAFFVPSLLFWRRSQNVKRLQTDKQIDRRYVAHDQARDLQINDDKGEAIKFYVNFASMSETNRTNLVDLISMI